MCGKAVEQLHSRPEVFLFALTGLTHPLRRDAGIDVLAPDAVATKELAAIFMPFVAGTFFSSPPWMSPTRPC
jgi:hypothetical protein